MADATVKHDYHLVKPSPWPLLASLAMLVMVLGVAGYLKGLFFIEKGAFAVACSRWLPLLPEAISCMAGLARMPFGKYCMALFSGAVPMCFAYAALARTSDNELVPLIISILLPIPIWWIAARLMRGSMQQ